MSTNSSFTGSRLLGAWSP